MAGHAVHIDDAELDVLVDRDVAIAVCPWAYLRLGQGVTRAGRHVEFAGRGGRLALGCDSENASDALDVLRAAALFAGLAKDMTMDPAAFTAIDALHLATLGGAQAIGCADEIGSLEVGKSADLAAFPIGHATPTFDPAAAAVFAIEGSRASLVTVAGVPLVVDGALTRANAGLRPRVQGYADKLRDWLMEGGELEPPPPVGVR